MLERLLSCAWESCPSACSAPGAAGHAHGADCAVTDCKDATHSHDHEHSKAKKARVVKKKHDLSGVSSVGITADGPLDFNGLNGYMMRLLQTNARDIYRSKGVLCFEGQGDTKFVFQAREAGAARELRPPKLLMTRPEPSARRRLAAAGGGACSLQPRPPPVRSACPMASIR